MALVPVVRGEIAVAIPLAWLDYDIERNLLRQNGEVLESQEELDALMGRGAAGIKRVNENPGLPRQSSVGWVECDLGPFCAHCHVA